MIHLAKSAERVTLLSVCLFSLTLLTLKAANYELGPESQVQEGIPLGTITKGMWKSKVYPGTERDYWVYVPAQYDASSPACLMVFNDGRSYVSPTGQFRTTTVFDNLIHAGAMPITIGVFVNPGVIPPAQAGQSGRQTRSFEYDALGDRYAKFLCDEFLPALAKDYHFSQNPECRAIGGISSGGIAAFTVAWERPESFRKVLCHIGSFTNIRGGNSYPFIVRKTDPKPLRIFLQEGMNDLDNLHGHWPLGNKEMAASLEFLNYDYKFIMGEESHNGRHGGAILPESLKWLWRDHTDLEP
jgi:enterochelin esterase-like enzyme